MYKLKRHVFYLCYIMNVTNPSCGTVNMIGSEHAMQSDLAVSLLTVQVQFVNTIYKSMCILDRHFHLHIF